MPSSGGAPSHTMVLTCTGEHFTTLGDPLLEKKAGREMSTGCSARSQREGKG